MFGAMPYGAVTFGGAGGFFTFSPPVSSSSGSGTDAPTSTSNDFFADLTRRRGQVTVGGNPSRFVELVGGKEVPMSWFEPSAKTFRSDYYYNTRANKLYKKSKVIHPLTKKLKAYWLLVSEC